jgi:hypothetical protein
VEIGFQLRMRAVRGKKRNVSQGISRGTLSTTCVEKGGKERRRRAASASWCSVSPLPASLSSDCCFALPFPLCAGFLVEPTLSELRVQSRTLNFTLELAEGPFEVFSLLDDHFQQYHAPQLNRLHFAGPIT